MSKISAVFRAASVAILIVLPQLVRAEPPCRADAPDLAGEYSVSGVNANGKAYHGRATVKKVGDIYRVTWRFGKAEHHGVGVVQSGVLSVTWAVDGDAGAGVVAYTIMEDGSLDGKWIDYDERGGVLPETLMPAAPR